jgi:transcription antitermination protein NusB
VSDTPPTPSKATATKPRASKPRSQASKLSGKAPPTRSARRIAREFALQGLYAWLVGRSEVAVVEAHLREHDGFGRCDTEHFDRLLHGCVLDAASIDAALAKHVDRETGALSPIEHATLMIGTYELMHCLEIPYKVVINEGVELAKAFGGTDGHKYVNGVLDKVAADVRTDEVNLRRLQAGL